MTRVLQQHEDGGGGNDEDEKSVDMRHGEEADLNGDRVRQGRVGRFVRGSDWEIWHSYGGGFECRWKYLRIQVEINRAVK